MNNLLAYLVPWARPVDVPPGSTAYFYHRNVRPYLLMFLAIAAVEASCAHLLLMNASPYVKWPILLIDDLGLLYLLAFTLSLAKLPILISPDGLRIRAGTLIDQWIPLKHVASVQPAWPLTATDRNRMLKASLMSHPDTIVTLNPPIEIALPLRGKREITLIGLHPDDPAAFVEELKNAARLQEP